MDVHFGASQVSIFDHSLGVTFPPLGFLKLTKRRGARRLFEKRGQEENHSLQEVVRVSA